MYPWIDSVALCFVLPHSSRALAEYPSEFQLSAVVGIWSSRSASLCCFLQSYSCQAIRYDSTSRAALTASLTHFGLRCFTASETCVDSIDSRTGRGLTPLLRRLEGPEMLDPLVKAGRHQNLPNSLYLSALSFEIPTYKTLLIVGSKRSHRVALDSTYESLVS